MEFAKILKANPYHDEKGRFSTHESAKTISVPNAKAALAKLSSIERVSLSGTRSENGNYVASVLDKLDESFNLQKMLPESVDFNTLRKEKVKISDLIDTQGIVKHSTLQEMILDPSKRRRAISVVEIEGKKYILDGHHRASAAKLLGEGTIEAAVYKLPKRVSKRSAFTY